MNDNTVVTNTSNTPIRSSDTLHDLHHTFFDPQAFDPNAQVKATLLVLHGMAEHSGRYVEFAEYLAKQGIAVATYDHLGHGQTANSVAELGFIRHKYPTQAVLQDVIIMANALKQRHPNVPHFIMGHSMGSFITRNVLQHHASQFAGAILSGTADKDPSIKPLIPMFTGLNKVLPKQRAPWAAAAMITVLGVKLKTKVKTKQASVFAWLSDNPDNVAAYEADERCGFVFTHNAFLALFELMDVALNKAWYANLSADFPMLVISGENDPVGNMSKGINKLVKRLTKKGYQQIKLHLYPQMRHEPLNESNNLQVYEDVATWLDAIAKRKVM